MGIGRISQGCPQDVSGSGCFVSVFTNCCIGFLFIKSFFIKDRLTRTLVEFSSIVVTADMIFYMAGDVSLMVLFQCDSAGPVLQLRECVKVRSPAEVKVVSISRTGHFHDSRGQAAVGHFH